MTATERIKEAESIAAAVTKTYPVDSVFYYATLVASLKVHMHDQQEKYEKKIEQLKSS